LLSVIIPYYNTSATVGRTIESVRSQTYRNIEIVLVDDRSPEPFPLDREGIVFIQHDTNRGLFQTRITGLEHSHGEYVAFLDSDDFVSDDFYRTLVQAAVDDDLDIVAGDTVFDKDGLCDVKNLHEANFGNERLSGDDVKKAFFGQQGTSFVWHTIWNKVYRRSLWERCLPEFRKVTERIGMLEDFMFSSVLFHKAESFRYVHNEGYHYCTNSASITAGSRDEDRYASNVRSICTVFGHVQSYLDHNEDDPRILNDFDEIRKLYSRMYRNTLENVHGFSSRKRELEKLVDGMMPGYNEVYSPRDRLFEDPRTVYDHTFEDIKQLIIDAETVSFDVFDTLVLRPFLDNDDIFTVMGYDPEISGLFGNVS
ncbi:MAG: glycosyltransferase, partial [archaeon]|nr:glycosyltransferase [archaeon]